MQQRSIMGERMKPRLKGLIAQDVLTGIEAALGTKSDAAILREDITCDLIKRPAVENTGLLHNRRVTPVKAADLLLGGLANFISRNFLDLLIGNTISKGKGMSIAVAEKSREVQGQGYGCEHGCRPGWLPFELGIVPYSNGS